MRHPVGYDALGVEIGMQLDRLIPPGWEYMNYLLVVHVLVRLLTARFRVESNSVKRTTNKRNRLDPAKTMFYYRLYRRSWRCLPYRSADAYTEHRSHRPREAIATETFGDISSYASFRSSF